MSYDDWKTTPPDTSLQDAANDAAADARVDDLVDVLGEEFVFGKDNDLLLEAIFDDETLGNIIAEHLDGGKLVESSFRGKGAEALAKLVRDAAVAVAGRSEVTEAYAEKMAENMSEYNGPDRWDED